MPKPFAAPDALFATRCRPVKHRLLFGRLALYEDALVLRGLALSGTYECRIALRDIERVEWSSGPGVNLVVFLKDAHPVPLIVKAPGLWKYTLQEHLPTLRVTATPKRVGLVSAA